MVNRRPALVKLQRCYAQAGYAQACAAQVSKYAAGKRRNPPPVIRP
jgi:hypothetical protein